MTRRGIGASSETESVQWADSFFDQKETSMDNSRGQISEENLQTMLDAIPSDDRQQWISVGATLKKMYGEDGFETWRDWSAKSDKYNPREIRGQWKSLNPRYGNLGVIVNLYKTAGGDPRAFSESPSPRDQVMNRLFEKTQASAMKAQNLQSQFDQERRQRAADRIENLLRHGYHVNGNQAYLKKKGIRPEITPLCREGDHGELFVPLFGERRSLKSMQTIWPDGTKRIAKDTAIKGTFHPLGDFDREWQSSRRPGERPIYVAEGLATAAALKRAGVPLVAMGVSATNLKPAIKTLGEIYPEARFVIAADQDQAGLQKACEAWRDDMRVLRVTAPALTPAETSHGNNDFDDLLRLHGEDETLNRAENWAIDPRAFLDRREVVYLEKATPKPIRPKEPEPLNAYAAALENYDPSMAAREIAQDIRAAQSSQQREGPTAEGPMRVEEHGFAAEADSRNLSGRESVYGLDAAEFDDGAPEAEREAVYIPDPVDRDAGYDGPGM